MLLIENGVTDERAVDLAAHVDFVGIDAPFGWPRAWAAAVARHRPGEPFDADGTPAALTRRETDLWVAANTGIHPLSVAANLIGATAIRCARLIHAIGKPIDAGLSPRAALTSEVYPAVALLRWGLPHRLYKGRSHQVARTDLVGSIVARGLPVTLAHAHRRALEASDDALDSLVCSLVARAVAIGLTDDAPPALRDAAAAEGWIRIPSSGSSLRMLSQDYPAMAVHSSTP